jgi:hypothetical protein
MAQLPRWKHALQGKYLSRRLAEEDASELITARKAPSSCRSGNRRQEGPVRTEHLRSLVSEAYGELDELYAWLRRSGVSKYGLGGSKPARHTAAPTASARRLGPSI